MITVKNFIAVLEYMRFIESDGEYIKYFSDYDDYLKVDFENRKLIYPEKIKGRERNAYFDEAHKENMVVFECVNRLLEKGYRPEHIELEKEWHLGHDAKGGRADICVTGADGNMLFIIECKTAGREYDNELRQTQTDGGQLISYWKQEDACQWLLLYASDWEDNRLTYRTDSISCSDDSNMRIAKKQDNSIKLYDDAHTVEELFAVWDETYEKRLFGDVVFRDDTVAYEIGAEPLRKKDLRDFSESDKVVNRFEEILRHNNVSDKENAFNRLVALFICKLVDEIQKDEDDVVEFQYKVGTDTYENLQDRLQRLHRDGMEKFMREEMFYVADDYAENLIRQYTGQKRVKLIAELKKTLRILKFYTNNDFAFKDVHNEELFYQNGKILVEVVQLFEEYRIIGSRDLQTLGDLFEQLLSKGFKQNEGQFFTPMPITRFVWDSLPLREILCKNEQEYPKIIDYACGAGHFLTQGFEAVNDLVQKDDRAWASEKLYGVEKDYRLARVSKISLFMHGAGNGNIVFGDGLENYMDKNIRPHSFDILVANPPYSVAAFKPHLKLKDNDFTILPKISNNGSEIETLFVERIAQLLKPQGVAAVILPSSILNKESESFVAARESLLKNFRLRAIVQMGSKTFGATGTNTVILFLEKFAEPPKKVDLCTDTVQAVLTAQSLEDWEDKDILTAYLEKIQVDRQIYGEFVTRQRNFNAWADVPYIDAYTKAFLSSAEYSTKVKQKGYQAKSEEEKLEWCNVSFYEFAIAKEAEKLLYYSLAYGQTALIVTAPNDNKGQEKFLGYGWSNRKGQEGIQIKKQGGLLYNPQDRQATDTLAALVRASFGVEEGLTGDLGEYYHYMPLTDMLDFSGVNFNKAIKTSKLRHQVVKEGMTAYKLDGREFSVSIGNRVVAAEIEEDGEYPVYSANVFEEFGRINKQNLTDFRKPSVIWGIDGDWMVNYLPENYPFYPTDHCGVIRVNTDKILPKYLALALQVEGEYERFSRSNRASTARIKNLTVQIPGVDVQRKVVEEIEAVDTQVAKLEQEIKQYDEEIKSRFVEMFGDPVTNPMKWPTKRFKDICTVGSSKRVYQSEQTAAGVPFLRVSDLISKIASNTETCDLYISEQQFNEFKQQGLVPNAGDILVTARGTLGQCYIIKPEDKFYFQDGMISWVHTSEAEINPVYVSYLFDSQSIRQQIDRVVSGTTVAYLSIAQLSNFDILLPAIELQNQFADFVAITDKSKNAAQSQISKLKQEKEAAIQKYFKS